MKIECPGCGSTSLTVFNQELFRCTYCGSLINPSKSKNVPTVIPPASMPSASYAGQDEWRKKYERRVMQNAGFLTDFIVDENSVLIKYEGVDADVVIPKGVKAIGKSVFHFNSELKNVIIPQGVTTIDLNAFFCCHNLQSVQIPSSVNTINRGAFTDSALETVTIPKGVSFLANDVFSGCKKLKSLNLPGGIKSIGDYALRETAITSINISDAEHIGSHAFRDCTELKELFIPKGMLYVDDHAFDLWEDDQIIHIYAKSAETWNRRWQKGCNAQIVLH